MSIETIKARAEAAKPGPWEWIVDSGSVVLAGSGEATEGHVLTVHICAACWNRQQPCMGGLPGDQAFIAHSRQDIPALLRAVQALDAARRLGHIEDDGLSQCPCRVHAEARAALAELEALP